ncbi:hypothetical protein ACIKT0_11480 [Hansschlegelia beijingensis]
MTPQLMQAIKLLVSSPRSSGSGSCCR